MARWQVGLRGIPGRIGRRDGNAMINSGRLQSLLPWEQQTSYFAYTVEMDMNKKNSHNCTIRRRPGDRSLQWRYGWLFSH